MFAKKGIEVAEKSIEEGNNELGEATNKLHGFIFKKLVFFRIKKLLLLHSKSISEIINLFFF